MTENLDLILKIAGIIITGLFGVMWFFIRSFIIKSEKNDKELVNTLTNLDHTMNEMNTNILILGNSTDSQFKATNKTLNDITTIINDHANRLDKVEDTVIELKINHNKYHKDDKI